MHNYLGLVDDIMENGVDLPDRTGTGRKSVFGRQLRFDLSDNQLPLVTTKRTWFRGILHELLWFVSGSTNVRELQKNGVHIWDEWADKDGSLGPVYGEQLRNRKSYYPRSGLAQVHYIDQLSDVVHSLKHNPKSRRHVVSLWNPEQLEHMNLHPCHGLVIQFFTDGEILSCHMYQRSADVFLGVPFNIASYSILTRMVAQVCGYEADELIISFGDAHLYTNHTDQVEELLEREPLPAPKLHINPDVDHIDDFVYDDFKLVGYKSHPNISAPVAV